MHFILWDRKHDLVVTNHLFIVMRYDEAMYVTKTWTFLTEAKARAFIARWIKNHQPTCEQGYDQYTMDLYKMPIGKPIDEVKP